MFKYDVKAAAALQYFLLRDVDTRPKDAAVFLLAIGFASSSVTIVSGALAERCKLTAYFTFAAVMSAITYPLVSHWCAQHKLSQLLLCTTCADGYYDLSLLSRFVYHADCFALQIELNVVNGSEWISM